MRIGDIGPGHWAMIAVGALVGTGLLAVFAAVASAATCWD